MKPINIKNNQVKASTLKKNFTNVSSWRTNNIIYIIQTKSAVSASLDQTFMLRVPDGSNRKIKNLNKLEMKTTKKNRFCHVSVNFIKGISLTPKLSPCSVRHASVPMVWAAAMPSITNDKKLEVWLQDVRDVSAGPNFRPQLRFRGFSCSVPEKKLRSRWTSEDWTFVWGTSGRGTSCRSQTPSGCRTPEGQRVRWKEGF